MPSLLIYVTTSSQEHSNYLVIHLFICQTAKLAGIEGPGETASKKGNENKRELWRLLLKHAKNSSSQKRTSNNVCEQVTSTLRRTQLVWQIINGSVDNDRTNSTGVSSD